MWEWMGTRQPAIPRSTVGVFGRARWHAFPFAGGRLFCGRLLIEAPLPALSVVPLEEYARAVPPDVLERDANQGSSRSSLTRRASSFGEKRFWRNATPASRRPRCKTASFV